MFRATGILVTTLVLLTAFAAEPDEIARKLDDLRGGTETEKIEAARWLALHEIRDALPLLREISRHTPPGEAGEELRTVAGMSSAFLRRPELLVYRTAEEVLAHLDDPDPAARADAVRLVPFFGIEDGIEKVAARLDDPDATVRLVAVGNLQFHPAPERVPRLVERVADPSEDVRKTAVFCLLGWSMQGLDVIGPLADALEAAETPEQRIRYLDAIERIARHGDLSATCTARVVPFLDDPDASVRMKAAMVIGAGDERAVASLAGLLVSEDPNRRLEAARALARSGARLDVETVTSVIRDPDLEVARQGVLMAAALPPAPSRRLLIETVGKEGQREELLTLAIAHLAEVGREEDVASLVEIGRASESHLVQVNVVVVLATLERRLGGTPALDWYREILEDDDVDRAVLTAAVEAVRQVGDASFFPLLAERLRACGAEEGSTITALAETISVLLGRQLHGDDFGRGGEGS